MKQKQQKNFKQSGFTLIELLVVLSIMVVIATVVIIDFNRQRSARSIVLAKNETITNLRKIQSYMLSSKNISEGVPAKFYIAEFELPVDSGPATNFTVQAIDNEFNFYDDLEVISLPGGLNYSSFQIEPLDGDKPIFYECLQIIFSAPFGNMYARGSSSCDGSIIDDLADPIALSQISQLRAILSIADSGTHAGSISINPVTGQMTAN